MTRTMRIAYFSPLAPLRTGISDYSEELLPHLCRRVHVDAYTDDRIAATQEVGRIYPLYGYRDLAAQRERYDQLIFQLGNGPEHAPIYDLFLRFGGIAVLHDLDLSGMDGGKSLPQGNGWGLLWEVKRSQGLGTFLQTAGDVLLRGQWPRHPALQANRLVPQRAAGLIVHSRAARAHLAARHPEVPVSYVPMGIPRPPLIDTHEARQALAVPAEAFVCVSVGRLEPNKRIHVALQAFARFLERCPDSLYIAIGDLVADRSLQEQAQALGIADKVRLTGYVDLPTLYRYLAACDVGLSLRYPTQSKMSASLLRMMSMGKPVVVSNCDPYAQLPSDCALKIDVGTGEVTHIAAALWALSGHPPMRRWYGQRAAHYVQAEHSLAAAARRYIEFVEELATVQEAEEILLHEQSL